MLMRILVCCLLLSAALCAQDWTPARIVAITDYAHLAALAQISGNVDVECTIDGNGSVVRAEALSGHPLLKEQARQNALLWKFKKSGAGESNKVTLKYQYRLKGDTEPGPHTEFAVDLPNTIEIVAPVAQFMP